VRANFFPKYFNFLGFKWQSFCLVLWCLLGLGLASCGNEEKPPVPFSPAVSSASNLTSPGKTSPSSLTAIVTPIKSAVAATAGPLSVTALPNVAPTGTLAVVQDGRLLLVKADGTSKEVADLGGDLSDKLVLRWSPDGNRFLLNEASRKLSLLESDGKRTPLLELDPANEKIGLISWAAGGKFLAFERIPAGERGREMRGQIWVADLSDPVKPTLQAAVDGFAPTFSPDGRNLAYVSYGRDVSEQGVVFNNAINITTVNGKQSRQVLDVDQLTDYRSPDGQVFELKPTLFNALSWSADGRSLAFQDGRNLVGSVASTGGKVRVWWYNATKEAGRVSNLVWSARNDRVSFNFVTDSDKTRSRLMLADTSGKALPLVGDCPEWSPDGSLLAATTGKELNIVRASDQQIYGSVKTSGCPIWSPDGVWLAVSLESGPEVGKGLLILHPDGSDFHPLPLISFNPTRQLKVLGWKK